MKKRVLFLLTIICCLSLAVGLLAACNDEDKKGGKDGRTGDSVFTESASLEDIVASLENAESLTFTYGYKTVGTDSAGEAYSEDATYQYKIAGNAFCNSATDTYNGETEVGVGYTYRSNGMDYDIITTYDEDGAADTDASKDLDMIYPKYYSDLLEEWGVYALTSLLTTDADGNIVADTSYIEGYIADTAYVKLNGSSIEIGWEEEYSDEDCSERTSSKYTWSGINATTIEIPAEVRALEAEAEWSDHVYYNGVSYIKATDADGSEYYYVGGHGAGAVSEKTINTLPVKENGNI